MLLLRPTRAPLLPRSTPFRPRPSYSTSSPRRLLHQLEPDSSPQPLPFKGKADWKRRQEGSNFIDTLNLSVLSGRGGAGGVAFHREKFKARGPPSGGPGGAGGSVYLLASPTVTNLSHLPRTIRGGAGASGGGSWLAGRRGDDVVVRVPVGTIVREVRREPKDEDAAEIERQEREELEWAYEANRVRLAEAEARDARWTAWKKRRDKAEKFGNPDDVEPWEEVDEVEVPQEKLMALSNLRKALFVMYPQAELEGHPHFLRTEHTLLSKLLSREVDMPDPKMRRRRRRRRARTDEDDTPLYLDLTKPTPLNEPILLVAGGQPGLGNPSFLTHEDRSPKYATRGGDGEMMRLELEVKSTGEVGLVGLPNAGKSTLLRALTSSTPRVASYAFTTLNPHHGTCILWSDGTFSGPRASPSSSSSSSSAPDEITDTPATPEYFTAASPRPSRAERRAQQPSTAPAPAEERSEVLRFTLTDNPGLVASASLNVGLGHAFLRHIERCAALVYVVDLSSADPLRAVEALRTELAAYARVKGLREGELEGRIRGVVANKADLFVAPRRAGAAEGEGEGEEDDAAGAAAAAESPEAGRAKLSALRDYVARVSADEVSRGVRRAEDPIWVVPVSAKRRENVQALVQRLAATVRTERERAAQREEIEALEAEEERLRVTGERWLGGEASNGSSSSE